jgi:folate-binding Fe-S cluster repair protein YgfZ
VVSTDPRPVASDGIDAAVPWHYGDPFGEHRDLAERAGVVDRSHRDVLTVTGEDRLSWLHTICSQHLSALGDGDSTQSLVL